MQLAQVIRPFQARVGNQFNLGQEWPDYVTSSIGQRAMICFSFVRKCSVFTTLADQVVVVEGSVELTRDSH
ncbi:MAG: hypothetical protein K1X78_15400 [Verrucomicrobiaceae bacterium]|nr:hypothetical protein [Verrucomicrobiaceae bacterium]